MKGKFCSENGWAREGFFGKKVPQTAEIKVLRGPRGRHPLSPQRVRHLPPVVWEGKHGELAADSTPRAPYPRGGADAHSPANCGARRSAFSPPPWRKRRSPRKGLTGVSPGSEWRVHAEPDDRTAPSPARARHGEDRDRGAAQGGPGGDRRGGAADRSRAGGDRRGQGRAAGARGEEEDRSRPRSARPRPSARKYRTQQLSVKKNDEYQALGHEIEDVQKQIDELEGKELEVMYAIDEAKKRFVGGRGDAQAEHRRPRGPDPGDEGEGRSPRRGAQGGVGRGFRGAGVRSRRPRLRPTTARPARRMPAVVADPGRQMRRLPPQGLERGRIRRAREDGGHGIRPLRPVRADGLLGVLRLADAPGAGHDRPLSFGAWLSLQVL